MQELIYQIKTRDIRPNRLNRVEGMTFFLGALVAPLVIAVAGGMWAIDAVSKKHQEQIGMQVVQNTSIKFRSSDSATPKLLAKNEPIYGGAPNVATLGITKKDGLGLKYDKELNFSVLYLNGKTRLGPAGRAKALEIAQSVGVNDYVELYGYAGVNSNGNKSFQTSTALARAFNLKLNLVDNGVEPSKIKLVDPLTYLYSEPLPADPKQVKVDVHGINSLKKTTKESDF